MASPFIACTDIGMSPCPVMKMIGSSRFAAASSRLEIDAALPRQSHVEHQAGGTIGWIGLEEVGNGRKYDDQDGGVCVRHLLLGLKDHGNEPLSRFAASARAITTCSPVSVFGLTRASEFGRSFVLSAATPFPYASRELCVRWPLVSFGCTSGNTAWAAAKRSARGRSEFRINPNMKSRGEILGSRATAQTAVPQDGLLVWRTALPTTAALTRLRTSRHLLLCFWDGPELTNG
jgi:hypothetical protein